MSKEQSPLVKAVLALDQHFSDLDRLGAKIISLDMKSESDFELAQRLLHHFAECGQGVSAEVLNLSTHLNDARMRAEAVAQSVSERAEKLDARRVQEQTKMEEFRVLGERVRDLNTAMIKLKRPEGDVLSDLDRANLSMRLSEFEMQLDPLIEEAQNLRKTAQQSKMKILEQNADSLTQTLQSIRQKLSSLNLPGHLPQ